MVIDNIAYSRPDATADRLAKCSADAGRFQHKTVLLTGEDDCLVTENGSLCFLNSLRLLVRFCRHLTVWVPVSRPELRHAARALAHSIQFGEPVHLLDTLPEVSHFDAVLNVGSCTYDDLPVVTINSEGWVTRVGSGLSPLRKSYARPNPIAALFAACMGASEVFKHLLGVFPSRAPAIGRLSFNIFSRTIDDADNGPLLLGPLEISNVWLIGLGAIGNGVVLLLSQIGARGELVPIDPQRYGSENQGTCVAIGPKDVGQEKAVAMGAFLSRSCALVGIPLVGDLEAIRARVGNDLRRPDLILAGLDNIEARHATQALWPDLLIDGAIGDFTVQAATHRWGSCLACMQCMFKLPPRDAAREVSHLTGLSLAKASEAEALITFDDVDNAPEVKKEFLRARLGKTVCSVASEAAISAISSTNHFSPSVPFVACASACLMVTSLVQHALNLDKCQPDRFYFDMLIGPHAGDNIAETADPNCICQTRRTTIDGWRRNA